jgi:hypothetical protein
VRVTFATVWTGPQYWSGLIGIYRYENSMTLHLLVLSVRIRWRENG